MNFPKSAIKSNQASSVGRENNDVHPGTPSCSVDMPVAWVRMNGRRTRLQIGTRGVPLHTNFLPRKPMQSIHLFASILAADSHNYHVLCLASIIQSKRMHHSYTLTYKLSRRNTIGFELDGRCSAYVLCDVAHREPEHHARPATRRGKSSQIKYEYECLIYSRIIGKCHGSDLFFHGTDGHMHQRQARRHDIMYIYTYTYIWW